MDTAAWYRSFSEIETAGSSPTYERLKRAISEDPELIARLDKPPAMKRLPTLLLAASGILDAPVDNPTEALRFMHERWGKLSGLMLARSTQTNEAARTATFLPLLAQIDGPIALIKIRPRPPGSASTPIAIGSATTTARGSVPPSPRWSSRCRPRGHCPARSGRPRGLLPDRHRPRPVGRERRGRHRVAVRACTEPSMQIGRNGYAPPSRWRRANRPTSFEATWWTPSTRSWPPVPDDVTPVVFHSAVLGYLRPRATDGIRSEDGRPSAGEVVLERAARCDRRGRHHAHGAPEHAGTIPFFVVGVCGRDAVAVSDPHGRWLTWAG